MDTQAANQLATIKQLVSDGHRREAKALCQLFVADHPDSEAGLMQLLMLDPSPLEEIAVLEAFLEHFPDHRFASRFRERLEEMRVVAMLSELVPETRAAPEQAATVLQSQGSQRLGEYLLTQRIISQAQLANAMREQERLAHTFERQRLGTILVLQGVLTPEQLAEALGQQIRKGFGELGDFLVGRKAITRTQLRQALERQAQHAVEAEQRYQQALRSVEQVKRGTGFLRRHVEAGTPPQRPTVPRLGEVLVELGMLNQQQIQELLEERDRIFYASFS